MQLFTNSDGSDPFFQVNEGQWVVGSVKPQALPVWHCIIRAKWSCRVSATLELLLSFRCWVWLMTSWNYCRVLGENIVSNAARPGSFVGGWGNRTRVCYRILASRALGLVHGVAVQTRENKQSVRSWKRMNIRCVHWGKIKKKNLMHKISEEFLKKKKKEKQIALSFQYPKNLYFPLSNLASEIRVR